MEHNLCDELLKEWCEKMLSLQLTECKDDGLYGGILCPSCSRVHGRCFDAMYPFMYLADTYNDERYLNGAKLLFDWAERVVSREDGSYVNDTNSEWKGTTVFCVIQLAQCLLYHGHILDSDTYNIWIKRLEKAAEFLINFEGIQNNNVNYRITNALAMHYCSILLNKPKFATVAQESASLAISNFTQKGFLFGEGSPGNGYTKRGCRAVDIGYNVEESLPSLAIYANLTEDDKLKKLLAKSMLTHLEFMLPDGAWDNSFGTRNFKWTYWGSRTSDGCALGYLIMAKENPAFYTAAKRNLNLLHECTHNGLLHGGPHYHLVGERACVHHTFAHAKVLAEILDYDLYKNRNEETLLPRETSTGISYYNDINTYQFNKDDMHATVSSYDWEYMPGGHASGGSITMLWHKLTGAILCASMSDYSLKELNNMQLPRFEHHECLTPRLELQEDGIKYSTVYDFCSEIKHSVMQDCTSIFAKGMLVDILHHTPNTDARHKTEYCFEKNKLTVSSQVHSGNLHFICPLISSCTEQVIMNANSITIEKEFATVCLVVIKGTLNVPYNEKRIYNLVPGFQAVKTDIFSTDSKIEFSITITEKNKK